MTPTRRKRIQITAAQQQALLTARAEGREITGTAREIGIDPKRAHNWLYLHRQQEGLPGPATTTKATQVPEVPARVGKSAVVRLDVALLAALKEKARREGRLVVEVLNRAAESYLRAGG